MSVCDPRSSVELARARDVATPGMFRSQPTGQRDGTTAIRACRIVVVAVPEEVPRAMDDALMLDRHAWSMMGWRGSKHPGTMRPSHALPAHSNALAWTSDIKRPTRPSRTFPAAPWAAR